MATYNEIAALRNKTILKDKVAVAVSKAALAILAEDITTSNHKQRLAWAQRALTMSRSSTAIK